MLGDSDCFWKKNQKSQKTYGQKSDTSACIVHLCPVLFLSHDIFLESR